MPYDEYGRYYSGIDPKYDIMAQQQNQSFGDPSLFNELVGGGKTMPPAGAGGTTGWGLSETGTAVKIGTDLFNAISTAYNNNQQLKEMRKYNNMIKDEIKDTRRRRQQAQDVINETWR